MRCASRSLAACTSDTCDGSGTCTHPAVANGSGCGSALVCVSGGCVNGCFIGGVLYGAGAANPGSSLVCVYGGCIPFASWDCGDGFGCGPFEHCCSGESGKHGCRNNLTQRL